VLAGLHQKILSQLKELERYPYLVKYMISVFYMEKKSIKDPVSDAYLGVLLAGHIDSVR